MVLNAIRHNSYTICSLDLKMATCGLVVAFLLFPQDVVLVRSLSQGEQNHLWGRRWGKVWEGVIIVLRIRKDIECPRGEGLVLPS